MSQENPTPEELSKIEQFQYGAYGAEPPEWWFDKKNAGTSKVPAEAVVTAAKVLYADKMSNHSGDNAPQIIDACEKVARKILEAAAPHIRAEAWDEGMAAAKLQSAGIKRARNPYKDD